MRYLFTLLILLLTFSFSHGAYLLIPMDQTQSNHLKSYGLAFWSLQNNVEVYWLLNYQGGSFMMKYHETIEQECIIRDITYHVIADSKSTAILTKISDPGVNMDAVKLHKAPKIVVYSPKNKQPWDDAVTLALTYAEIPYDVIYDEEVLDGVLPLYDWLHLHHEDFTGQYGKFWRAYKNVAWYQENQRAAEETAQAMGFQKVSQCKLAVAKAIRDFVLGGGYLFAMCSAPDSFDVALAAEGVDICDVMFDGDPIEQGAQQKLNYDNCLAFKDFTISTNPYEYEISSIDMTQHRKVPKNLDMFTLFEFSAKWDPVPSMLCQNHEQIIKGFMGQTTAFNRDNIKSDVLIMGETKLSNEARYIHGEYGKGIWTYLGGHDPEDFQHRIGDPPTDLNLHPNSAGYRLILNNVLFPAAKKKKQKT
ncbi:MAG: asparagine synthetase B [Bacteroidetes bacterium]|nr:MAG: asparagine synthetase B [Bacteroidota bacterium]PIE87876.1 MAG: asparagine synthetase B [Bacteroidota bacterium]